MLSGWEGPTVPPLSQQQLTAYVCRRVQIALSLQKIMLPCDAAG